MHDDFFSFVASTGAGVSPDPVMRFATLLPCHGPYFSSEVQPLVHAALLNTAILRCASGSSAPALDICCRLLACDALPAAFRGRCRTVLARILVHVGSKHSHEVLLALTQHSQMQPALCSAHEAAVSLLMRDNIVPSDGMQSDADENTNLHIAHAALLSALCVFHGNVSVALPSVQHLLARCTQSSMMWDIAASVAHSGGALRRTVACCRSAEDRQRASVFSRLLKAKALICIGDGAAAVTAATDAVSATEGTVLSTTARHVLGVALGLSGSQSGSLQNQHELVRIAAPLWYLTIWLYCFESLHHQYFSFLAVLLTFYSQLVRAIEHLTVAAAEPTYPLKSSAQTSLALALAHSRNIPAAIDACRVALTLDSRNERAAGVWLLLISVLESADYVMEVADTLKSQLPNSRLVHFVIAGLQVPKSTLLHYFNHYFCRRPWGSTSSASFHART